MRRMHSAWIPILALFLVTLLTIGMVLLVRPPQSAQADSVSAPAAQKSDNSACLACHGKPGQSYTLRSGEVLSISVDPTAFDQSTHATLACQTCHTNIASYPHPQNTAQDSRSYTLQYKDTCKQCHPDQSKQLADSVHTTILNQGNRNAPICSDCHNPHTQAAIPLDASGNLISSEDATIAKTCARCHNAIYQEYLTSIHGSGIIDNKNPDIPACTDCHGVHTIQGPDSPGFRINSPTQVCGKCHTDENKMKKYGISTQVLNTYVADFHGTTVTLFEKQSPEQQTNKPVCFDCHGVHNIARTDDPNKGLQIKQNLLVACQKCHPDATLNFPDSWLSHYIPTPGKYPLVYYINLFYLILIPLVLGGMALILATDIFRRVRTRGKPVH